jgi:hypothetical protein
MDLHTPNFSILLIVFCCFCLKVGAILAPVCIDHCPTPFEAPEAPEIGQVYPLKEPCDILKNKRTRSSTDESNTPQARRFLGDHSHHHSVFFLP